MTDSRSGFEVGVLEAVEAAEDRRGKNDMLLGTAGDGFSGRDDERWLATEPLLLLKGRSFECADEKVETFGYRGIV